MQDTWDPAQYERFAAERNAPFYELLALVKPVPGGRAVDLGCGTGALTAELHRHLGARETVGIDRSTAMLARAEPLAGGGLRFEPGDIADFGAGPDGRSPASWDVIFSNAALQWVPNHEALLARFAAALAPGGQLAVQVPANDDHLSHTIAWELATEPPFREVLGGGRPLTVQAPDWYALELDRLGFAEQQVRLQVFLHHLPDPADVVEWVKGTLLTWYRRRLGAELYERFLAAYRERLLGSLGDVRPYPYPYKRILFWGRLPGR
jgi:trans-aconitate 2-methyltransferase